jgi:signal peptidase II
MSEPTRALRGSIAIAAAIVLVDQITKQWALSALADGPIDVIWTLRFNLVFNRGMAFSQAEGLGPLIGVVALVVVVILLVSLRKGAGSWGTVGVGLVVGGAVGNIIDRLFRDDGWFRGAVVDFIDFQWFPVFNVADMAINFGAGALIVGAFLGARREREEDHAEFDSSVSSEPAEPTDEP